jgi:hypothetical protein
MAINRSDLSSESGLASEEQGCGGWLPRHESVRVVRREIPEVGIDSVDKADGFSERSERWSAARWGVTDGRRLRALLWSLEILTLVFLDGWFASAALARIAER